MSLRKFIFAFLAFCLFLTLAQSQVLLKTGKRFQGSLNDATRFRTGQNPLSGQNGASGVTEITVTQKLDHFNPLSTKTWQQRVFINDTFFNAANGIVFLILGGEGPASAHSVQDHFVVAQYAKQFGALIVSAEHRFYGNSNPTESLSVENGLRYLSTDQALEDFATVRNYIVDKYNIGNRAKVVTFGGSYSGSLSSFARQKYPHLFVGALASSAPVLAQLDFHQYMDVVAASVGPSCTSTMRAATIAFEKLSASEAGRKQLDSLFTTCRPLSGETNDVATFFSSISDPVCGVVQYNNDNNNYSGPWNITKMCDTVQSSADPVEGYVKFVNEYRKFMGEECITSSYEDYVNELKNEKTYAQGNLGAAGRSWIWQVCTEYGYLQSADGQKQPFSNKLTLDWFLNQCKDVYGLDVDSVAPAIRNTNQRYGGSQPRFVENIFYTNGDVDPWHFLRVQASSAETSLMHGTAHCADLYPPRDADVDDLTSTREVFLSKLKQWVM